ncbi:MAG: PIN domain-containing protein [Solirubrobacteraceae bacterium]
MVDAGVLYSAADLADPDHESAVATLRDWGGELVSSPLTLAEADHLILSRLGIDAEIAFAKGLAGAFTVTALDARSLNAAAQLCERYRDLELGLADASIIVLAARYGTRSLATFDQRHFRAVTALTGGAFELLPADAPGVASR